MLLEMQLRLAQQWMDVANAGLEAMSELTAGPTEKRAPAPDRMPAAADVPARLPAGMGWGSPASAPSPFAFLPGLGWPMAGQAGSWPLAQVPATAWPGGTWPWLWGAGSSGPAAFAGMQPWSWPLGFNNPMAPGVGGQPFGIGFWSAPWQNGNAANQMSAMFAFGEAVMAMYRSAGEMAAAFAPAPLPQAQESPRLPSPFAFWEAFLPRR